MSCRHAYMLLAGAALLCLAAAPAAGQDDGGRTLPRTPDGRPDLQGHWTMATFTPLERPERFAGEFTVDDPTSWMRPWSAEIPMTRTDELMFEYACHEGNHDIVNILTMSRNLDRQAAAKAGGGSK